MSIPSQVELERLRYWQGQRLRAHDFRDQMTGEAQLRWWHNRALHNAFGVRLGLAVCPVPATGPLRAVRVACGIAYDCFGRELILQSAQEILVPAAPAQENQPTMRMTLLMQYKETAQFPHRKDLAAVCPPCSGSLFQEAAAFAWQRADRVQVTDGVPLAQVKYNNQPAALDLQFRVPISRAFAKPHLANGATIPEHTVWEPWVIEIDARPLRVGMQTRIDTSAAGFTRTPCYFAWLQGSLADGEGQPGLFPYFAHIAEASSTGFIFRLLLPGSQGDLELSRSASTGGLLTMLAGSALHGASRAQRRAAQGRGLYVCWLGCQMESGPTMGCPDQPQTDCP